MSSFGVLFRIAKNSSFLVLIFTEKEYSFDFRSLETISPDIACLFESSAKELLSKSDPVEVLSKALALVSGNTEITSRSLLSSQQGYTTFLIRQNWALRGTGLIWKMLNEDNDETVTGQIRGMRLCKDKLVRISFQMFELSFLVSAKVTAVVALF